VAELTHVRGELNESVAGLQEQIHQLQLASARHQNESETSKKQLQRAEDELRDTARKLETAEDRIHYLQDIAIPDLNNSAMETVEKSKSEQVNLVLPFERKINSDTSNKIQYFCHI
jgi:seryl-tRNA synthetase